MIPDCLLIVSISIQLVYHFLQISSQHQHRMFLWFGLSSLLIVIVINSICFCPHITLHIHNIFSGIKCQELRAGMGRGSKRSKIEGRIIMGKFTSQSLEIWSSCIQFHKHNLFCLVDGEGFTAEGSYTQTARNSSILMLMVSK